MDHSEINFEEHQNAIQHIAGIVHQLAGIGEADFMPSMDFWDIKRYEKGDYYNQHHQVCKHLGFIISGVFRTYYIDQKSGEEKNVFFYSKNQPVVSFQSFIHQLPCNYFTQAMTDAVVVTIHIDHLRTLYREVHSWERFGRILAEMAFSVSMQRTESFLFQTPEERYLDLIRIHPDIFQAVPLYHISSYLGIQGPSLSRIRKRLVEQ